MLQHTKTFYKEQFGDGPFLFQHDYKLLHIIHKDMDDEPGVEELES